MFCSVCVSVLVVSGAPLPFAGVVQAGCAGGVGDEVGGAGRHEVGHGRRDVHPLVSHQIICSPEANTSARRTAFEGETMKIDHFLTANIEIANQINIIRF